MWTLLLALQANAAQPLQAPLCEASGLAALEEGAFVAIDNEEQNYLFLLSATGEQKVVPLNASPARDYEAVVVHEGVLTVIASHSRKKLKAGVCRVDSRRAMFGWAPVTDLQNMTWVSSEHTGHFENPGQCEEQLFAGVTTNGSKRLCGWLSQKDMAAKSGSDACRDTLNIEGAAVVDGHLWVGLRAPLVDGSAVVLRVAGGLPVQRGLVADKVAYVAISGGIRAMASDESYLYFVSGGSQSRRWRIALKKLNESTWLTPEDLGPVLPDTEGLVVTETSVLGVTDGSAGAHQCKEASQLWQTPRN
jgi:hypothetical protein